MIGLYRSRRPYINFEEHGGAKIRRESYDYLGIYENSFVGLYGAGQESYKWYFLPDSMDYKGFISRKSGASYRIQLKDMELDRELVWDIEFDENMKSYEVLSMNGDERQELYFDFIDIDYTEYPKVHGDIVAKTWVEFIEHDRRKKRIKVFNGTEILLLDSKDDLIYVEVQDRTRLQGWLRREDVKFWSEY